MDPRADVNPAPQSRKLAQRLRAFLQMLSRYVGVGLLVAASDYAVYGLAVWVGATVLVANLVSRMVATVVGAWLHRRYTFAGPQRMGMPRQMVAFGVLSAVNLLISSGLIVLLHDHLGLNPLWSKLGTDVVIVLISLVVSRLLIFAPAR